MKPLEEIYSERFFARRKSLMWRAPIVCKAINDALEPKSVVDVGCAIGDYVNEWENNYNIFAFGVEGSNHVLNYTICKCVYIHDMRLPIPNGLEWVDLLTAFEVVEHVEEEYADILVENLTKLSNRILISAATPGQGGHHHVNCQPHSYWIEKFMMHNYSYDETITCLVKAGLFAWRNKKELRSYYNNLLYFEKGDKND